MNAFIRLYSNKSGEISNFLKHFFNNQTINIDNDLLWEKEYINPIETVDMIGALIENKDDYKINMWISLDKDIFINVTEKNADEIIRYLYERYPY